MTILAYSRVPPFGHLWLIARFQLTKAFRRIPRPSSPLTAKASTVCASLLDHIISVASNYMLICLLQDACVTSLSTKFLMNVWLLQIKTSSLLKCFNLNKSLKNSLYGGAEEDRTPDPLRARQVLSQLSYDPFLLRSFPLLCVAWTHSFAPAPWLKKNLSQKLNLWCSCSR